MEVLSQLQASVGETMSACHSFTTIQGPIVSIDAKSVIAAKRSELQTLWDEICADGPSSSAEPQFTGTEDCTYRLHQLVKELQGVDCERPPSHIDRLPDELLYRIFSLIVSPIVLDIRRMDSDGTMSTIEFNLDYSVWRRDSSLILNMVCKQWQVIMLSSPSLWSSLVVDGERFEPEHLQIYLHLSRDHPLTLYLIAPNEEALLALKAHAHRIQHLYILARTRGQWRLEILSDGATTVLDHTGFDTALCVPTSSILSLRLDRQSPPLKSLCDFQHLQHLVIHGGININDLSLIPDHVSLPHLHGLVLDEIQSEESISPLKRLLVQTLQVLVLEFPNISYKEFTSLQSYIYQMPNLISVSLTMTPSDLDWPENSLPPELFSSSIQHMELNWLGATRGPLHLVAGIRSLERLVLFGVMLRSSISEYCLCSTLRELVLDMRNYAGHEIWDIEEMQGISLPCLEKLELSVPHRYGETLLDKLVAPSLLWVRFDPDPYHYQIPYTAAAFIHSSQLQYLCIHKLCFENFCHIPSFSQLRTLYLCTKYWGLLTLLEAPQLVELRVMFLGVEDLSGSGDISGRYHLSMSQY